MTKITAKVIADSKNEFGNRITTFVVVFPRYILAELNTHRMLSKNSASSRAIPTKKMIRMVMNTPFIPIAWQKDHAGMQGTEYFDENQKFQVTEIKDVMLERLNKVYEGESIDPEIMQMFENILLQFTDRLTLTEFWLKIRDKVVEAVVLLYCLGVTKQIVNRLMEPFMYHTVLITATELENMFSLRCPRYTFGADVYRSKIDAIAGQNLGGKSDGFDTLQWLMLNKGMADIHMMALAECIYDAYNESTPKQLKSMEWHIPFGDDIKLGDAEPLGYNISNVIKVATARCARVSYTVVGEEGKPADYEADIKLHDRLSKSGHWSCFEHCAQAMDSDMYNNDSKNGWSGNFKGFIQYRKLFANENVTK